MPKRPLSSQNQTPVIIAMASAAEGMSYFDRVPIFDPSLPMKVDDVARFLRTSPRHIYRLVDTGALKAHKVSGTLYFNPREIYSMVGMEDYLPKKWEVV